MVDRLPYVAAFMLCVMLFVLLCRAKWFKESATSVWSKWRVLHPFVQIFCIVALCWFTTFATIKTNTPSSPMGMEPEGTSIESVFYGSAATTTSSKDLPNILADDEYERLSPGEDSFISRTVTNTQLTWLVMPTNAFVYPGWTNYGVAEDTFWVNATNPASSWGFVYAEKLVDGAHVSSSGTLSFNIPKGSPTPHEMAG